MMMYSAQDRPDLARILYKQQALFALGMLGVQWRLVCTPAAWERWMSAVWCAAWSLCAWNCAKLFPPRAPQSRHPPFPRSGLRWACREVYARKLSRRGILPYLHQTGLIPLQLAARGINI